MTFVQPDLSYLEGSVISGVTLDEKTKVCPCSYFGFALEGSSLGMVGYTILPWHQTPQIFWSHYEERIDMDSAVAFARYMLNLAHSPKLIIEGARSVNLIAKELTPVIRTSYTRPELIQFARTSGGYYKLEEVMLAVLTDIRSERISTLECFKDRPEREVLMSHLASIEAREEKLTALQQAFIYGLGYWSCAVKRPKYGSGVVEGFRVY